jgi:nucleoside-diphosphate-sugar epimerase
MILVTGAAGHVGRAVVSRLASLGLDVVAMVRDVQAANRRLPSGTALRVADVRQTGRLIAGSPFRERHRSRTGILEFTISRWLCIMHCHPRFRAISSSARVGVCALGLVAPVG